MTALVGGTLLAGLALLALTPLARRRLHAEETADVSAAARPRGARTVAAALCAEHVSAVGVLAVAGLVVERGTVGLWPVPALALGYVLLSGLVVGPLRRSQVYTLSDFAEWRLGYRPARRVVSACVMVIGWLGLLAQIVVAGRLTHLLTGAPESVGWMVLLAVALPITLVGTVGSSAGYQALYFWLLVGALALPLPVLGVVAGARPPAAALVPDGAAAGPEPLAAAAMFLAVAVGTVGVPQFVSRLYATPDPRAARRTIAVLLALAGAVAAIPAGYALLARYGGPAVADPEPNGLVMVAVPGHVADGGMAAALTSLVAAGIAAATLAAVVGLLTVVGGTFSQCVLGGGMGPFRVSVVLAVAVPLVVLASSPAVTRLDAGALLLAAWQLGAVTLAPMLLIGIWWRGLTDVGLVAGLLTGLVASLGLGVATVAGVLSGPAAVLAAHPVPVLLPAVCAVMYGVSVATRRRVPETVDGMLRRMHPPRPSAPQGSDVPFIARIRPFVDPTVPRGDGVQPPVDRHR